MKNLLLKTTLILGFVLTYGMSFGQTIIENCSKKGTADCPIVKDCPKKGTADCPYAKANSETASAEIVKASEELANCSLAGTPDCPLIKNCPKKGTADCPYTKKAETADLAENAEIPACCKKKNKKK